MIRVAIAYLTCSENNLYFNLERLTSHINSSELCEVNLYKYINDEKCNYNIVNNEIYFSYKNITNQFNYPYRWYNQDCAAGYNSGLQQFVLFDLYIKHSDYDYYMFYEDDLMLNTSKNIFDNIDLNNDVYLPIPRNTNGYWHWYYLNNNIRHILPCAQGLLNLYIVKNEVLKNFIESILGNMYYGYDEVLVNGFFERYKDTYKTFYLNKKYNVQTVLPNEPIQVNKQCEIIHPVKTLNQYNNFLNTNII